MSSTKFKDPETDIFSTKVIHGIIDSSHLLAAIEQLVQGSSSSAMET